MHTHACTDDRGREREERQKERGQDMGETGRQTHGKREREREVLMKHIIIV